VSRKRILPICLFIFTLFSLPVGKSTDRRFIYCGHSSRNVPCLLRSCGQKLWKPDSLWETHRAILSQCNCQKAPPFAATSNLPTALGVIGSQPKKACLCVILLTVPPPAFLKPRNCSMSLSFMVLVNMWTCLWDEIAGTDVIMTICLASYKQNLVFLIYIYIYIYIYISFNLQHAWYDLLKINFKI
jgi:hypothetical protein